MRVLVRSRAMADIPNLLSPVGFFIEAPGALADPSALLADNIDPETRDFADLFVGSDVIDAQVQHALSVIRGSGVSVQDDGIADLPRKMGDTYKSRYEVSVRRALKRLVDAGDIRIKSIVFDLDEPGEQTSQIRVQYINLRTVSAATKSASVSVPGRIV